MLLAGNNTADFSVLWLRYVLYSTDYPIVKSCDVCCNYEDFIKIFKVILLLMLNIIMRMEYTTILKLLLCEQNC